MSFFYNLSLVCWFLSGFLLFFFAVFAATGATSLRGKAWMPALAALVALALHLGAVGLGASSYGLANDAIALCALGVIGGCLSPFALLALA
jgi:hypothetical protein